MKRYRTIFMILTLLLSLSYSTLIPRANDNILSMEIKIAAQTGIYVQIIEPHEQHLLSNLVTTYFEPFTDEALALESAATILEELNRYQTDVLQRLNITFYLVHTKSSIAGLTVIRRPKTGCDIYISASRERNYKAERNTLSHEIFHCYDSDDAIQAWTNQFDISKHVSSTWGTISDDEIYVNYAAEERAEYFSAAVTRDYSRFQDDAQSELKQQVMLPDVYTLMKDTSVLPVMRTYYVRTWSQGKINEIREVSAKEQSIRHYEFDYRNNSYIITDYRTNVRSVISMAS